MPKTTYHFTRKTADKKARSLRKQGYKVKRSKYKNGYKLTATKRRGTMR